MINAPEFWVAVAFFIFFGILGYFDVHKLIGNALDSRANRIRSELDEARRLREEANKVLADYKRREEEAHAEADAIIAYAKQEAERLATEGKVKVEEFVARRTKLAEAKIAQAETQAMADVRAAAADAAAKAAERILVKEVKGQLADDLIAKGLGDVKARMN
ncbi:ATP F0F1 synthase subunit B [Blastochloris viridis]|uniref:ATP synthase subunit b n=1 Tax=Blastochloris viridis TaxID=1079 RepID=A0A0H5BPN7_BLAVI|nr:ATP F0F1 synthase subunit B [Blastochloris viridis]ALK10450.1 ATP synthase subunit b precursor [Blastochloris viridis]BAR99608.1 ATP synthase F0 sector subunit b [Blastochloris viridis]CUU43112.1 F-type ATPase subunit b [Blastochloris viridis]